MLRIVICKCITEYFWVRKWASDPKNPDPVVSTLQSFPNVAFSPSWINSEKSSQCSSCISSGKVSSVFSRKQIECSHKLSSEICCIYLFIIFHKSYPLLTVIHYFNVFSRCHLLICLFHFFSICEFSSGGPKIFKFSLTP